MTFNEFIKEVKRLGYHMLARKRYIFINKSSEDATGLITIRNDQLLEFSSTNNGFRDLSDKQRIELVDVVLKYASTPVEHREYVYYVE